MIKNWFRSEWPLAAALGLWIVYLAGQVLAMRGSISFASDDAYMRLAIGRTLAETGAWGINPGQFASAVGTLLWPLLLAAANLVAGTHKANPLILNGVLSCFFVISLDRAARRVMPGSWLRLIAVAFAVLILPLAPLVLEGMEHTLQLLLTLALLEGMLRALDRARWSGWWLAGCAMLLTATRYEGIFVVALVATALALASRKQVPLAATVLIAGALPVVIYGWISYHNGWLPVPSDVYFRRAPLVPENIAGMWAVLLRPLDLLNQDAALRALLLAPLVGLVWVESAKLQMEAQQRVWLRALLLLGVMILHLLLIGLRQSRYDAYLVLFGWWAMLPWIQTVADYFRSEKLAFRSVTGAAIALLAVLLFFPMINRGVSETAGWWQSRADFRDLQMAAVSALHRESISLEVATDFPGALAYNGFRVLDLTGMASADLARARRAGGIRTKDIANDVAVRHITIALVSDPTQRALLPITWSGRIWSSLPDSAGSPQDILYFDIR